ncbi:subtype B tannase [Niallia sp. JL1B1071]|uniref:subtype B tannase n=1 Tax=Niallia tiangongensis TaxID=3237105 RepID=UPI0037DDC6A6
MGYSLDFNQSNYETKTLTLDNQTIEYRAFEKIVYVEYPVDVQFHTMNIYVPDAYFKGEAIGPYTSDRAPILLINTVGGYKPGEPGGPGQGRFGEANAAFFALKQGYVVAMPGVRGRSLQDDNGRNIGVAPAAIIDLKAAVRYLRHNRAVIPGDTEKIVSNGTSAGGALSSLLGATGNHQDYEPYLEKIGAAKERDDIFAASCYCPITNLEHADAAYEWLFHGLNDYKKKKIERVNGEIKKTPIEGTMSVDQITLSAELKRNFPPYLNSLGLKSSNGETLTLDESGKGSFQKHVQSFLIDSAKTALAKGEDLSELEWITINNGNVIDLDFGQFILFATRMKPPLAFDDIELKTPENELFGTASIKAQHFSAFAEEHTQVDGSLADATIIKMMNPMDYIGSSENVTSSHWRIRHGSVDRDTSLAIPIILATTLMNKGYNVDFTLPWGQGHGGDYDLDELFAWIDNIALKK